jgi:predicted metal-dependent hydrolase
MTGLTGDGRYWHGIALFNEGAYFESHEALEEIWTGERGPDRLFLQGLIHVAVAWHHYGTGNLDGARRQFRKALKKLAGYLPQYAGIATLELYRDGLVWRDALIEDREITGGATIWKCGDSSS